MPKSAAAFLYLLLAVLPLSAGLLLAFLVSLGLAGFLGTGFTLDYWGALLGRWAFWQSLGFSFYIAAVGTLLALVLALFFTIAQRHRLQRRAFHTFLYLPLALPTLVMALYAYYLLSPTGWLSRLSLALGWTSAAADFPRLVQDAAGVAILVVHTLMSTFFFTVYLGQLWPKENLDALLQTGRNLGATFTQLLRRVVLPTLLKRAAPVILLYFVFALGSYEIPLLLGRSHPQMLSVYVMDLLDSYQLETIPQAYGLAALYTSFMALLLLLLSAGRRLKQKPV